MSSMPIPANVIALPHENPEKVCEYVKSHGFAPKIWRGFDNTGGKKEYGPGAEPHFPGKGYTPDTTKWALSTEHTYEVDNPGSGYRISNTLIGCLMSHWTLWGALDYLGQDEWYHVMEADIKFRDGWRARHDKAMEDVPRDWDMIYPGSCCADHSTPIKGDVYKGSAMCTHWYMVRHTALKTLVETNQKAQAPIDIQLIMESHPHLNVYTILPRLADQFNTDLHD